MSSDEEEIKCSKTKKFILNSDSDDDTEKNGEHPKNVSSEQRSDEEILISNKIHESVKESINSNSDCEEGEHDFKLLNNSETSSSQANKFTIDKDRPTYDAEENSSPNKNVTVKLFGDKDLYDAESSSDEDISCPSFVKKKKVNTFTDDKDTYDADERSVSSPINKDESINRFGDKDLYDAEGSSDEERANQSPLQKKQSKKLREKALLNSDGSSDEETCVRDSPPIDTTERPKKQVRKSAKIARAEIEGIHSESQRIVRESRISLPYHIPKQRSLSEFLQRRKSAPITSLHSKDKLNLVWKHLEEREKEAVNFYKSESEHSDKENIESVTNSNIETETNEPKTIDIDIPDNIYQNDVIEVINSIVDKIVNNDKRDSEMEIDSVDTKEKDTTNNDILVNESKIIEHTITAVNNITTSNESMVVETQSFELHLSEGFTESLTEIKVNNTDKETVEEPKRISDSQNFFLHLNESEPFTEDINVEFKQTLEEQSIIISDVSKSEVLKTVVDCTKISEKLNNVINVPKLSGDPSEVIDLDVDVKPGVTDLMQRFIKHISLKTKVAHKKSMISVVTAERDESGQVNDIKEEIMKLAESEDEEEDPKLSKPGAKLAKLKAKLKAQIGQQREVEWTKKVKDQQFYENEEDVFADEKSDCGADDDASESVNDEEEEEEEVEDEADEEENEDDEVYYDVKKKSKNEFVDEEAEETDNAGEDEEGEDSLDSFIKKPKKLTPPFKRMKSDDLFASQEYMETKDDDEDDDPLTIGQDSKDRVDTEEVSDGEQNENNILTDSPAFPLTAPERKHLRNLINESSPILSQSDKFNHFKKADLEGHSSSGLDDLIISQPMPAATQDLIGLCSGQFTAKTIHCSQLETSQEGVKDESQELELAWPEEDSQLSLESLQPKQRDKQESPNTKDNLLLSDDEDMLDFKKSGRKRCKLNFSDDEEESQHEQDKIVVEEEENKSGDEDEFIEEDTGQNDEVEYDSEENEIPRDAKQFLEKEAELSESEWDSEDEDENGLDLLEQEEADKEAIDHDADKEELGKMHIRRMLVEDSKEVKLLQEILLEDGDLHSDGGGRQRLFRWSNQDGDDEIKKSLVGDSDDEIGEDEEEEESWRRSRHERESFLREQKSKQTVEIEELDMDDDSQLFKLGKAALRKKPSNQEPKLTLPTNPLTSPDSKRSLLLQSKRGSFLSRGQQVLSRLAQITSASNSNAPVTKPTHSRNFVFASISPKKDDEDKPKESVGVKRKILGPTLPIAKKPCLSRLDTKFGKKKSLLEQLMKCES